MSNIKGTIVNVKDFLSQEAVTIKISGTDEKVFELEKGRTYVIPDFQREIRWQPENLIELMNDISRRDKFLGNLILTRNENKKYSIIDGQQRTSLLLMLIQFTMAKYGDELTAPPELCTIENESFPEYGTFQKNNYSFSEMEPSLAEEVKASDQYKQAERFQLLWKTIEDSEIIADSSSARDFLTNLYRCEFNIILSEEDSTNYSIEYFLDVNLKGIKLDAEDIFKGYLFHLDSSDASRQLWVEMKRKSLEFNELCRTTHSKSDCYPLMKMIEHFLYCYIYDNDKYTDVVFGEDFCLKQKVLIDRTMHYAGEHILKVINNNKFIREMLEKIIKFLTIAIDIVSNSGPGAKFKSLFVVDDPEEKIDDVDISNFFTFMQMVLKDRKVVVSKAVVIKYTLNTLMNSSDNRKESYKKLYAVQMFATLFSLFESKKGIEPVEKILKSANWDEEIRTAIATYCNKDTIEERKRSAEFKYGTNPDNEQQRYHSIALAAVYNFFVFQKDKLGVKKGEATNLNVFLTNTEMFSVEHFIVNNSFKCKVKYADSEDYYEYEYPADVKKYVASIFNFIFIPRTINENLGNKPIVDKLAEVSVDSTTCEYSRVVIEAAQKSFKPLPVIKKAADEENKRALDKYFAYDFKQQYAAFVSIILKNIAKKFSIA